MRTYNCLIIDDEPPHRKNIIDELKKYKDLKLIKECSDVFEANQVMREQEIDIIFLDLGLPEVDGFEWLRTSFRGKIMPCVIAITAFKDRALEGFELNVCHFLHKPFSPLKFSQAIERAIPCITNQNKVQIDEGTESPNPKYYLILKAINSRRFTTNRTKELRIAIDEICYFASQGNNILLYTTYQNNAEKLTQNYSLRNLEHNLPRQFLRISKAYIVAKDKIRSRQDNHLEISTGQGNKVLLSIGATYKRSVDKLFK